MATSKERDKEHGKWHLAMNTPSIVSLQVFRTYFINMHYPSSIASSQSIACNSRKHPRQIIALRPAIMPSTSLGSLPQNPHTKGIPSVGTALASKSIRPRLGSVGLSDSISRI